MQKSGLVNRWHLVSASRVAQLALAVGLVLSFVDIAAAATKIRINEAQSRNCSAGASSCSTNYQAVPSGSHWEIDTVSCEVHAGSHLGAMYFLVTDSNGTDIIRHYVVPVKIGSTLSTTNYALNHSVLWFIEAKHNLKNVVVDKTDAVSFRCTVSGYQVTP